MTANQNSIPRELVFDVDAMLDGRLDTVPFPFIGTNVPEGHQGQSVEGMSHGCVLSKLKTGFHRRRIAWSFNADHQPIGGKFDAREDALVAGACSPATSRSICRPSSRRLSAGRPAAWVSATSRPISSTACARAWRRVGLTLDDAEFATLLAHRLAGAAEDEAPRRQSTPRRATRRSRPRSDEHICASSRSTSCPA